MTMTMAEAKREFSSFAQRFHWSDAEQAMIPVLSEDMIVPAEAMKIARRFVATWEDKRPDFDNMLKKTTHTLIEQIDQLSFIASQFSNLAKTPNGEAVYVDVSAPTTSDPCTAPAAPASDCISVI